MKPCTFAAVTWRQAFSGYTEGKGQKRPSNLSKEHLFAERHFPLASFPPVLFPNKLRARRIGLGRIIADGLLKPPALALAPADDSGFYRSAHPPATFLAPSASAERRGRRAKSRCPQAQLTLAFDSVFDPDDASDVFHHMPVVRSLEEDEPDESFESDEVLAKLFGEVGLRLVPG